MSPIIIVTLLVMAYVLLGVQTSPDRPRARQMADRSRPGHAE